MKQHESLTCSFCEVLLSLQRFYFESFLICELGCIVLMQFALRSKSNLLFAGNSVVHQQHKGKEIVEEYVSSPVFSDRDED